MITTAIRQRNVRAAGRALDGFVVIRSVLFCCSQVDEMASRSIVWTMRRWGIPNNPLQNGDAGASGQCCDQHQLPTKVVHFVRLVGRGIRCFLLPVIGTGRAAYVLGDRSSAAGALCCHRAVFTRKVCDIGKDSVTGFRSQSRETVRTMRPASTWCQYEESRSVTLGIEDGSRSWC
jgi:hypothetical protein